MKLQRYISTLLLAFSTLSAAMAYDANGANVYYDNTASQWASVQLLIGHSTWSSGIGLSKVPNTNNLYYSSVTWGGYGSFLFISDSNGAIWGGEGKSPDNRKTWAANYSATNYSWGLNNGSSLFVSTGTAKGAAINGIWLNKGYTDLNYTQTIQKHTSTDGGSTFTDTEVASGAVTASTYVLSGVAATGAASASIASTATTTSMTVSAARTATVTLTATPADGYRFSGWYNGTAQVSAATTYTYTATDANTYTARFTEIPQTPSVAVVPAVSSINEQEYLQLTITLSNLVDGTGYAYRIKAGDNTLSTITSVQNGESTYTATSLLAAGTYSIVVELYTTADNTVISTATISDFTVVPCLYFKNTLGWSGVYAYLFSDNAWWDDGTGVHPAAPTKITAGQMTRLGESDVYYYPLSTDCQYVAFSETDMTEYNEFYQGKAVYRGDKTAAVNMFIPDPDQTPSVTNENKYYSTGVWMCYTSTASGYYLTGAFNTWSKDANPFTAANANTYTFTTTVALGAATTYSFKLYRTKDDNSYFYGSSATITQTNCSDIAFDANTNTDAQITTTSAGGYVFTLTFNEGKLLLSVKYPVSTGDYRLAYREGTESAPTKFHPAHTLRQNSSATTAAPSYDTVSFFVDKSASSAILLQQCTDASGTEPTWTTQTTYAVSDISAITATGVYNFIVQQNGSSATLQTDQTHAYTGNYYIRTDVASGGWNDYRSSTNRMTYSDYAHSNGENFDYYYCAWVLSGRNVKYTVANAYSECVSDTLAGDDITGFTNELCPANANIRYAWNSQTNALSRAYIDGAGESETEFLVLHGNTASGAAHIYTTTDGDAQSAITFADKGNWVYQIDIYANPNALVKLTAKYNTNTQYLKGAESTTFSDDDYTIIGGSADSDTKYRLRVVYDFKTNHLVGAWLPSGEITTTEVINANMMIVRNHQEGATQITFNGEDARLTQVQTVYGVLTLDKATLNNTALSQYERALYWISFPFDVSLNEVFGFGEYGKHWILEYYDGAERAEKGLWKESKYRYWKFVSESERKDFVMKANMGYVVGLDLDELTSSSSVFANTDQVALYFPSKTQVSTVKQQNVTVTLDEYKCTITRDNRNIYDSNWHLMGVPSFADNTLSYSSDSEDEKVGFYYQWDATTNGFTVQKTGSTAFRAMYAYLVQYAGDITWTAVSGVVQSLAARRSPSYAQQTYTLRLQLLTNGNALDQTYIQWQEESATSGFDFNLDLAKTVNNKGSNLYSLIGVDSIQAAANVLPLDDVQTVVPIGLYCNKAGDYTFSLPDGMEGWMPVLVDNETHTSTNLLLSDYTVHLSAGTHDKRFVLRLQGCTTGGDTQSVKNGEDTLQKLLINGHLYIRQGTRLYDVLGR